jgi:hypothetical protein
MTFREVDRTEQGTALRVELSRTDYHDWVVVWVVDDEGVKIEIDETLTLDELRALIAQAETIAKGWPTR